MKKILFAALMCCTLQATAQTEITPYKPGVNAEGVTYILPRTALRVDLLVAFEKGLIVVNILLRHPYYPLNSCGNYCTTKNRRCLFEDTA